MNPWFWTENHVEYGFKFDVIRCALKQNLISPACRVAIKWGGGGGGEKVPEN